MFDIGLFELIVVGGVSLVVIGPEKLPGAIRTGALWVGRLKRTITNTRREIEEHIGADEIRRELRNEEIMASLDKLRSTREQLEADIKSIADSSTLEHQDDAHESHENQDHEHPEYDEHGHVIENQTDSDYHDEHHHDVYEHDAYEHDAHDSTVDDGTLDNHSQYSNTDQDNGHDAEKTAKPLAKQNGDSASTHASTRASMPKNSAQATQDTLSSDVKDAPNDAPKPSDHTPS